MGFLSSISSSLFGSKPSSSTKTAPTLSPEQQRALNETLLPFLTGTPLESVQGEAFPGAEGFQFTQPLTSGETTSLAALEQQALQGVQPTEGANFLTQFFQFDQEGFDEFFEASITRPLLESFERDILPTITRRAAGTGNLFGTETQGLIERAGENLTDTIASQRAIQEFQARQSGQDRALSAATTTEQLGAAGFESARAREFDAAQLQSQQGIQQAGQQIQAALGLEAAEAERATVQLQQITQSIIAQGLPREIANQEIAAQYSDFLRQQGVQDTRINQLLASIGLPTTENITTVTGGSGGLLGGALSGFAQGFGSTF